MNTNARLLGRALAQTAVTLDANSVSHGGERQCDLHRRLRNRRYRRAGRKRSSKRSALDCGGSASSLLRKDREAQRGRRWAEPDRSRHPPRRRTRAGIARDQRALALHGADHELEAGATWGGGRSGRAVGVLARGDLVRHSPKSKVVTPGVPVPGDFSATQGTGATSRSTRREDGRARSALGAFEHENAAMETGPHGSPTDSRGREARRRARGRSRPPPRPRGGRGGRAPL